MELTFLVSFVAGEFALSRARPAKLITDLAIANPSLAVTRSILMLTQSRSLRGGVMYQSSH
jgi:hypothetical protein